MVVLEGADGSELAEFSEFSEFSERSAIYISARSSFIDHPMR